MGALVHGNEDAAIARLGEAEALLPALVGTGLPDKLARSLILRRGVAHMRRGETQNWCLRKSPDSCIVPIRGGGSHT